MSRKDFELIAATIAALPSHSANLRANRESVARAFARALSDTNPRFDSNHFLRACGVEL